ncbi:MAG: HAMP domain-containing protein [Armatimonadetes bacterium]|nr:HAMP domain-containing protein [Armatimonadota bacterium]
MFRRLSILFGLLATVPLVFSGVLISIRGWYGIQASGQVVADEGRRSLREASDYFHRQASGSLSGAAATLAGVAGNHLNKTTGEAMQAGASALGESTEKMSDRGVAAVSDATESMMHVSEDALSTALGQFQRSKQNSLRQLSDSFAERMKRQISSSTPQLQEDLRRTFDQLWEAPADRRAARVLEYAESTLGEIVLRMQAPLQSVGIWNEVSARAILLRLLKPPTARPTLLRAILVSDGGEERVRVPDGEAVPGEEVAWENSPIWQRLLQSDAALVREPVQWEERRRQWILRLAHKVISDPDPPPETEGAPLQTMTLRGPRPFVVVDVELSQLVEMATLDRPAGMEILVLHADDGRVISAADPQQLNSHARVVLEQLPRGEQARAYQSKSYFFRYETMDGTPRHGAARYWGLLGNCWTVVVQSDEEVYRPVSEFEKGITASWTRALGEVQKSSGRLIEEGQVQAEREQQVLIRKARERMKSSERKLRTQVTRDLEQDKSAELGRWKANLAKTASALAKRVQKQMDQDASQAAQEAQDSIRDTLQLRQNAFAHDIDIRAQQRAGRVARQMILYSAGLIPLFLCLALILATVTARSMVRPMDRLVRGTQALAAGRYEERIQVRGHDELARLGMAFNDMASAIERGQSDLQLSHDTLSAEKARLEAITNASPDGLIMLEELGRIVFLNPAAARLLNIPRERLPEAPFDLPSLPEEHSQALRRCLAEAENAEGVHEFEFQEPQRQVLQLREVQVRTRSGRSYGRLIHLHDITRERIIDEMKSDFISLVSHELRTPLTSILGFSSYLLTGKLGAVGDVQRQALESIHRQARRLSAIISDFLDVSRIESGKIEMKKEPVSIADITSRVIEDLRPQAQEKAVRVSTVLEGEETQLLALGDEPRIAQVFTNLVGNALKFTEREGEIEVRLVRQNGDLLCRVRDTGCGIPQDELDKVFDRFYQVEKVVNRKTGGTGLGLAIVKNIVEAHGGRIWIESELGLGTQVSFTIPAAS